MCPLGVTLHVIYDRLDESVFARSRLLSLAGDFFPSPSDARFGCLEARRCVTEVILRSCRARASRQSASLTRRVEMRRYEKETRSKNEVVARMDVDFESVSDAPTKTSYLYAAREGKGNLLLTSLDDRHSTEDDVKDHVHCEHSQTQFTLIFFRTLHSPSYPLSYQV